MLYLLTKEIANAAVVINRGPFYGAFFRAVTVNINRTIGGNHIDRYWMVINRQSIYGNIVTAFIDRNNIISSMLPLKPGLLSTRR